jgi:hypothetical protein
MKLCPLTLTTLHSRPSLSNGCPAENSLMNLRLLGSIGSFEDVKLW